ncbi:kappaPI-actitoxin-Avd3c-like [Stomoxys calcitrans]|uniref:kappaPI-actitoxin-Avd3c-like n=1 Tax=Stomoxys calcitrans TaxID=35570 RepID=UPI0027E276A2|nr:kappaPI-actitoxin-Avd3c-like [Stomoxys calcitrans]
MKIKFALVLLSIFGLASSTIVLKSAICGYEVDAGFCAVPQTRYTYLFNANECVPFVYNGCGGNANKFPSRRLCEQICKL